MARAAITVSEIPRHGSVSPTFVSGNATDDHELVNDGRTSLIFRNLDTSPNTVTIVSVDDPYGRDGDMSVVVPAAAAGVPGMHVVDHLLPELWNQSDGKVHIDLTADTDFAIAAGTQSSRVVGQFVGILVILDRRES